MRSRASGENRDRSGEEVSEASPFCEREKRVGARFSSSPDRSRLAPLDLDRTQLACATPNREPVRRLPSLGACSLDIALIVWKTFRHDATK